MKFHRDLLSVSNISPLKVTIIGLWSLLWGSGKTWLSKSRYIEGWIIDKSISENLLVEGSQRVLTLELRRPKSFSIIKFSSSIPLGLS